MKIIDYRYVRMWKLHDLEVKVCAMIRDQGYLPHGAPFEESQGYVQAMVKYEECRAVPEQPEMGPLFSHEIMQMAHVAEDLGIFMVKNGIREMGPIKLRYDTKPQEPPMGPGVP